VLSPFAKRGEVCAALLGEFGVILDWPDERPMTKYDDTPGAFATGVSSILGAGGRLNCIRHYVVVMI
jgi:hypothetical protein